MRFAFGFARLPVVLLCLVGLAFAGGAGAQQPSKELKDLQETSTAFWKAGDFTSALQFAERALPLVIREYGPEHEQTEDEVAHVRLSRELLPDAQRFLDVDGDDARHA